MVPLAMLGVAGMTAIETSAAGVTVRPVEPDTLPKVAVMVAEPWAAEVARPFEPDALLMEATLLLDDPQVTELVRPWVE